MQHAGKKQIVIGIIGVLLFLFLCYFRKQVLNVLIVFALAVSFTVILSPVCRCLEKIGVGPSLAAFISVLLLIFVAVLTIGVLFPYMIAQFLSFVKNNLHELAECFVQTQDWFEKLGLDLIQWPQFLGLLSEKAGGLMTAIIRTGITVSANVGKYSIASVMAYYLLRDRIEISRQLFLMIPISYRSLLSTTLIGCRNAFLGYLSSVIKTSLFVFAATYIGLQFLHVPDALFLSLQMSLLEIFPYIGPFLASIPILLMSASGGIVKMIYALILVVTVQQLEGSFIGPYFTASSTAVHPLTALVGVFIFGNFFGIWGILLAVPILTIVQSIIWSVVQMRSNNRT